ncbi:hypothetical protein ACN20G_29935 (plasmid) [Streptomyces sp. BI20]|uniref:hypothetical protein n=1 Tax=Streptomyces sp. BI20 TaxID=3403460 RepID=UPI003C769DC0
MFENNPAKLMGIAGAILALIAVYVPGLPQESILAVVAALVGGGFYAQKKEDDKTDEAYEAIPDTVEAVNRQNELMRAMVAAENDRKAASMTETQAMGTAEQQVVTWGR